MGGIYYRPDYDLTNALQRAEVIGLVAQLKGGIQAHHGVALSAWVKVLKGFEAAKVSKRILEFESGHRDARLPANLIRAFAITFAAGCLAIDSKILPWTHEQVKEITSEVLRSASSGAQAAERERPNPWGVMRDYLGDPQQVPHIEADEFLPVPLKSILGLRRNLNGVPAVALRKTKLQELFGTIKAFLAVVREKNGLIVDRSHSRPSDTKQLPVRIPREGGKSSKTERPRFYVVKADVLDELIREKAAAAEP